MPSKSKKGKIGLGAVVPFRLRSGEIVSGTVTIVHETTAGIVMTIRRGDFINSIRERDIIGKS